jgi:hypothetical protein
MRRELVPLLYAGIVMLLSTSAFAEVVRTPACRLGGVKATISDSDNGDVDTGTAKVVPETAVRFTSGAGSNCVIVQFSGEINTDGIVLITARLNGSDFPQPADNAIGFDGLGGRSFSFVFTDVAPGTHTAVIVASRIGGTFGSVGPYRNIIVFYTPP